jgi:ribosomal-protein-alanine N-acetyltransferase
MINIFLTPTQLLLTTPRLVLESIDERHTRELWELFQDPDLHNFVPFEPPTMEKQRERCVQWAKRQSPDGSEIWLNWAGREKKTGKIAAHFQVGIKSGQNVASIGYLVARQFQKQGLATEGLQEIFNFLKETCSIREVKAWSDTRNEASHRLAKKLGMIQVAFIKDADFFKGSSSDEFVFLKFLIHELAQTCANHSKLSERG